MATLVPQYNELGNRPSSLERLDLESIERLSQGEDVPVLILDNNDDFDCEIPSEKGE